MSRRGLSRGAATLLVLVILFVTSSWVVGTPARGATTTPVTGSIVGPSVLGEQLKATYTVHATGGPAELPNGTQVGAYGFNATLSAANTSGALVVPSTGVLINGSATVSVTAPNRTEVLTLAFQVRSSYAGQNVSTNLSFTISVLEPYRLKATLIVGPSATVGPFGLTVILDGSTVGTVAIPTLTAGSNYPVNFAYVSTGLSSGWHTFSISLGQEHGLVTFPGGYESYTQSFYVPGPPPDNTTWYVAGFVAFFGAIFIWTTRVAARRRGRLKK